MSNARKLAAWLAAAVAAGALLGACGGLDTLRGQLDMRIRSPESEPATALGTEAERLQTPVALPEAAAVPER